MTTCVTRDLVVKLTKTKTTLTTSVMIRLSFTPKKRRSFSFCQKFRLNNLFCALHVLEHFQDDLNVSKKQNLAKIDYSYYLIKVTDMYTLVNSK